MKKIIILLFVVSILLFCVGCEGEDGWKNEDGTTCDGYPQDSVYIGGHRDSMDERARDYNATATAEAGK